MSFCQFKYEHIQEVENMYRILTEGGITVLTVEPVKDMTQVKRKLDNLKVLCITFILEWKLRAMQMISFKKKYIKESIF